MPVNHFEPLTYEEVQAASKDTRLNNAFIMLIGVSHVHANTEPNDVTKRDFHYVTSILTNMMTPQKNELMSESVEHRETLGFALQFIEEHLSGDAATKHNIDYVRQKFGIDPHAHYELGHRGRVERERCSQPGLPDFAGG